MIGYYKLRIEFEIEIEFIVHGNFVMVHWGNWFISITFLYSTKNEFLIEAWLLFSYRFKYCAQEVQELWFKFVMYQMWLDVQMIIFFNQCNHHVFPYDVIVSICYLWII